MHMYAVRKTAENQPSGLMSLHGAQSDAEFHAKSMRESDDSHWTYVADTDPVNVDVTDVLED